MTSGDRSSKGSVDPGAKNPRQSTDRQSKKQSPKESATHDRERPQERRSHGATGPRTRKGKERTERCSAARRKKKSKKKPISPLPINVSVGSSLHLGGAPRRLQRLSRPSKRRGRPPSDEVALRQRRIVERPVKGHQRKVLAHELYPDKDQHIADQRLRTDLNRGKRRGILQKPKGPPVVDVADSMQGSKPGRPPGETAETLAFIDRFAQGKSDGKSTHDLAPHLYPDLPLADAHAAARSFSSKHKLQIKERMRKLSPD